MSRISPARKLATIGGLIALVGGGFAVYAGTSNAAEDCGGLNTALANNQNFIAGQRTNPDAQSTARIANRQAVVDLIQSRRATAGCGNAPAAGNNNQARRGSGENCGGLDQALANNQSFIAGQRKSPDAQSTARIANRQAVVDLIQSRRAAAGCTGAPAAAQPAPAAPAAPAAPPANNNGGNNNAGNNNNGGANNGATVCPGTLTNDGAGGDGASSGTFPIGTKLSVTNPANNLSTVVTVDSVSGSCLLIHRGALNKIHEPGKENIKNAVIRKIG